mmetsp:Transcript_14594/g.43744  ORF Transcript_14594/g.43744 Transcript_14594/m.43744 type:complete len:723 (+) Transcript_14594:1758-3926(+)
MRRALPGKPHGSDHARIGRREAARVAQAGVRRRQVPAGAVPRARLRARPDEEAREGAGAPERERRVALELAVEALANHGDVDAADADRALRAPRADARRAVQVHALVAGAGVGGVRPGEARDVGGGAGRAVDAALLAPVGAEGAAGTLALARPRRVPARRASLALGRAGGAAVAARRADLAGRELRGALLAPLRAGRARQRQRLARGAVGAQGAGRRRARALGAVGAAGAAQAGHGARGALGVRRRRAPQAARLARTPCELPGAARRAGHHRGVAELPRGARAADDGPVARDAVLVGAGETGVEQQGLLRPRGQRVDQPGGRRLLGRDDERGAVVDLRRDHGAARHGADEAGGVAGPAELDVAVEGVQLQPLERRPDGLRLERAGGLDGLPQHVAVRGAVGRLVGGGLRKPLRVARAEVRGGAEEAVVVPELEALVPLRRAQEAVAVRHADVLDDAVVAGMGDEHRAGVHVQHVRVPDDVRHVVQVAAAHVDVGPEALDLVDEVREVRLAGLVLVVARHLHAQLHRRGVGALAHRLREGLRLVREDDGARAGPVQHPEGGGHVLPAGREHREDVLVALVVERLGGAGREEDLPGLLRHRGVDPRDPRARGTDHEVQVREAGAGGVEHVLQDPGGLRLRGLVVADEQGQVDGAVAARQPQASLGVQRLGPEGEALHHLGAVDRVAARGRDGPAQAHLARLRGGGARRGGPHDGQGQEGSPAAE